MHGDPFGQLDAAIEAATPEEGPGLVVALSARLAALGASLAARTATPVPKQDANVDVAEAARRLGVSVRYVYRHAQELPAVRMGRRLVFSSRGLDDYIRRRART